MQILNSVNNNPNLSIALGFFDGVHMAHKRLIENAVELARTNDLKSAVITFSKSPSEYFSNTRVEYITENAQKWKLIEELGVDYIYMLDFESVKNLSADDYLNDILIKNFNPRFIVTGFNHTFGYHKSGCPGFLKEKQGSYKYIELDKIKINSTLVSSTNVKRFIQKGYLPEASHLLGRKFEISNTVVKGEQLGRKIGYKTANILWPENIVKLPYGVYFAEVTTDKKYDAIVSFGVKPTVSNEHKETLEAHIFDFDDDIYGNKITVSFKNKIRDEMRFSNLYELKNQIALDVEKCGKYRLIQNDSN